MTIKLNQYLESTTSCQRSVLYCVALPFVHVYWFFQESLTFEDVFISYGMTALLDSPQKELSEDVILGN